MIGLFQEHGPCLFDNVSKSAPRINPYSWNSVSNILYVDQPAGVGFSYGQDQVYSSVSAADFMWKFLQVFLTHFPQYENRDFGLFSESYGGHYAPAMASYLRVLHPIIFST